MLVSLFVWSEVQSCIWPSWCHCHSLSLASLKSTLVLPFWYRLTWVVPVKGPLNGCVCVWGEYTLSKKPGGWYTRVYPPIHHWDHHQLLCGWPLNGLFKRMEYEFMDWAVVLRPTWHKTRYLRDVSPSQSHRLVWRKLSPTQQKHAFTDQKKNVQHKTKCKKLKPGLVAFYDIRPGKAKDK